MLSTLSDGYKSSLKLSSGLIRNDLTEPSTAGLIKFTRISLKVVIFSDLSQTLSSSGVQVPSTLFVSGSREKKDTPSRVLGDKGRLTVSKST